MTYPEQQSAAPPTAPSRRPHAPRLHIVEEQRASTHPIAAPASPGSGVAWTRRYRTRLRLGDAAAIGGAVVATFAARFDFVAVPASMTAVYSYWIVAVLVVVVWLSTMAAFHTRDSRILCLGITEYRRVVSASVMAFGLLASVFAFVQADLVRWYLVVAFPIGIAALVLNRWGWRRWLVWHGRRGHSLSRVIVVGHWADVEYVVHQISLKSSAAYTVVGAVIDADHAGFQHSLGERIPVRYGLGDVARTAEILGADAVVVASQPSGRGDFVKKLAWDLEGTATELILAAGLANVAGPRIHFRPVEGLPLIHVEIPQFEGGKHLLKRALDVVASGTAMVVLAPSLLLLALIVRIDSEGPALFLQERVGRDGRTFTIVKFRTMVTTATTDLAGLLEHNNGNGLLFKMKNDPRVTRVGKYLRKYSLDELPQLWNIFVGDMSLVGPRPPLAIEVAGYETHVHRRLYIRPGLTGMWQVNGRSNLGWEEGVQLDLYYVENWSLIGDIVILWRTVRAVLRPNGAY